VGARRPTRQGRRAKRSSRLERRLRGGGGGGYAELGRGRAPAVGQGAELGRAREGGGWAAGIGQVGRGGAGAPARWPVGRLPGEPKMEGEFLFSIFVPVLALIHH
jgi:hypothetical protein